GTLVFLMGMANLPKIVERLKRHGRPGDTPSSVIRWGTWPEQVTVVGMLDDIVEKVQAAGLKNPAVIVVGEVCKLRDRLKWIERRPLFGRRILVTRSREQASVLSNTIARLGGEALEFPTIAIEEPLDWTPLDRAIQEIGAYNWVVFTSVNGVRYFFARLRALGRDVRGLAGVRICAIGPVTKAALEERGLLVEYVPVEFQAAEIARGMQAIIEPGDRILLPRADIAPKMLAEALERMGARVDDVTTYRTVPGTGDVEAVREMFETGRMDMVTFTSSSTVRNFVSTLGADRIDGLLKGVAVACIGSVTADTAVEYGLKVDAVADEHTIDGLVAAIRGYFGGSGS
ncbi:MAG: uroporphyrinogen-III synthase, partial [Bacillota bacterium]|nr:uroporphyrinogen-III synthase [Bacillota bacterium]